MSAGPSDTERELHLHRAVLDAYRAPDVHESARRLVVLAVELVGAVRGYLAIYDTERAREVPPIVSYAHACAPADVEQMRELVSTTVIEDTLRTRRITSVASALGHPRYAHASSVRDNRITSVICAPLGSEKRGVLYLQDRAGGGVFSAAHERAISRLADLSAALIDRVVADVARALQSPSHALGADSRNPRFGRVIGRSPAIEAVLDRLWARRADRGPVWLHGPRGVGKAFLATELHRWCATTEPWSAFDATRTRPVVPREGTLLVRRLDCLGHDQQRDVVSACAARDVRLLVTTRLDAALAPEVHERLAPGRVEVPPWSARGADAARLVEHLGRQEAERRAVSWPGADAHATQALLRTLVDLGPREVAAQLGWALDHAPTRPLGESDLPPASATSLLRLQSLFELPPGSWREAKHAFQAAYLERAMHLGDEDADATAAGLGMSRSRLYEALRERRNDSGVDGA